VGIAAGLPLVAGDLGIQDHQVHWGGAGVLEEATRPGQVARFGEDARAPVAREQHGHQVAGVGVVLDDEDANGFGRARGRVHRGHSPQRRAY
jgi:hypothetical protein